MSPDFQSRYLRLLGLDAAPPGVDALNAIVAAQSRIVFENLTSLVRYDNHGARGVVPPADTDELLSSWESGAGGGVCYEIAPTLVRLLDGLGYEPQPILASVAFPGSHSAALVSLEGNRYLVDCGGGAPFLTAIPIDAPSEVRRAGLTYRFRIDATNPGLLIQDRWVKAEWSPFMRYDLAPSTPEARESSYQAHHIADGRSFVLSSFRLVRIAEDRVVQLFNHELTTYTDEGKRVEEVSGLPRYREVIAEVFSLPNAPVEQALATWSRLNGTSI